MTFPRNNHMLISVSLILITRIIVYEYIVFHRRDLYVSLLSVLSSYTMVRRIRSKSVYIYIVRMLIYGVPNKHRVYYRNNASTIHTYVADLTSSNPVCVYLTLCLYTCIQDHNHKSYRRAPFSCRKTAHPSWRLSVYYRALSLSGWRCVCVFRAMLCERVGTTISLCIL